MPVLLERLMNNLGQQSATPSDGMLSGNGIVNCRLVRKNWGMSKRAHLLVVALTLSLLAGRPAEARTWTDASGQGHVEADFIAFQADKVWLHRSDGRVFGVALDELSQPDRQYVAQQIRLAEARQAEPTAVVPGRISYGPGRQVCRLANPAIDESSGLARSRRRGGFFWTHNDSGDEARVYLFDTEGRDLGSCVLDNVMAFDFEDMFSFESDGKSYLVLCDVGNNFRASTVQIMYMIEEPRIGADDRVAVSKVPVVETINFSYEDDHRDCEAVAVDPTTKTIFFVTRERGGSCYVYALPWPPHVPNKAFVARKIATLEIPATTAMDISSDGRRAVVLTYGNAFEYVRGADEDWSEGFSRTPREIIAPVRIQGESICYGADDKTLYLTSEKRPTPLFEIPVIDRQSEAR